MRSRQPVLCAVADLGFGDGGKGLLTDALVRRTGVRLVVRYNGGAQAGHNVVAPGGRHHTFSQFGAGTFVEGVRTFLSRHVVVHPAALVLEGQVLRAKGVGDVFSRLAVSENARVITPYHQALGRLRELARGASAHGTCGVGVGETVGDALAFPEETVRAGDLRRGPRLLSKLEAVRRRKRAEAEALGPDLPRCDAVRREMAVLEDDGLAARWLEACVPVGGVTAGGCLLAEWIAECGGAVFEGAQGVLLDEAWGFHPHTTWSDCTFRNALELCGEAAPGASVLRFGVLRSFAVRHGPGPLPTECTDVAPLVSEHNRSDGWQGDVRYGWFDAVLARYALDAAGPLERLVMTHLDLPPRLGRWRFCRAYDLAAGEPASEFAAERDEGGAVTRLALPSPGDLCLQSRLGDLLNAASPIYGECPPDAASLIGSAGRLLGRSVDAFSTGPSAADLQGDLLPF